jgi:hypothetical protein
MRCGVVPLLREDLRSPPESLVQAVWQHQRVFRDKLKTSDGQEVKVLHPGFRSVEGGPDFRGAVIQFGEDPPKGGDVEVDLRASGWRAHGHDRNPTFKNVILHVVWEPEQARRASPRTGLDPAPISVALRDLLDAPLGELNLWLGSEASQSLPEDLRGKCSAPLRELNDTQLTQLLHEAARVRLQSKTAQLQARAKRAGWEQTLWEGLFRALGYKHNVWPMHRLAELRPRWIDRNGGAVKMQARLLGLSGLLPTELPRSQPRGDQYLRQVWDHWWRERDGFSDCILPRSMWRFHGIRPANHPQRRLALASGWSTDTGLANKLETWCGRDLSANALVASLLEVLQVGEDEFWSWHCTFGSPRLKKAQPLLGAGRVTDLAVNVVLPWLWVRAGEARRESLQKRIEARYFDWPAAEDNSLLKLARQRLLGNRSKKTLNGAAAQQGLIQIVRDFCERSNALCEHCQFPEMVREWKVEEKLQAPTANVQPRKGSASGTSKVQPSS